ncbi:circadian clock-controlled protein [Clostridium gasigenes]|uniref:Circadian clock-controlled protein n=1 Tax=Clostridium gasigenes TaxID=94869 RepID=A0A7X0VSI6_9CLOT|nr:circadian clock-controlled protein [Clostridium gasigenes]MBB6715968.1 circadian clock-controlled protein [Clostridium gasigenes]
MVCKISVSFRRSTKEQKIYNYFNGLEDKSIEIKNILSEWYEKNVESEEIKEPKGIEKVNLDTDITDF